MSDLTITLTGEVRESNFEEWKDGLVERIRAVDVELSADDDFASANDSIRQLRAAEQTLKSAKQTALEQAEEINRLFDAVDAVTEETRQARLALERKIRVRRQERRQRALQTHADANAATLDALPAAQQALFQDRAALLGLPFDELESTIAQRVAVWQAALADSSRDAVAGSFDDSDVSEGEDAHGAASAPGGDPLVDTGHAEDAPTSFDGESPVGTLTDTDTGSEERSRAWRVTIDLSAPRAKADQLFSRVRERWKGDRAVIGVDLSALD